VKLISQATSWHWGQLIPKAVLDEECHLAPRRQWAEHVPKDRWLLGSRVLLIINESVVSVFQSEMAPMLV